MVTCGRGFPQLLPQIASREGYIELVQLILSMVSVSKGDSGPMQGKDELKWADVNTRTRADQTAVMLAVSPAVSGVRASSLLPPTPAPCPQTFRKANRTIAEFEDTMSLRPVEGEVSGRVCVRRSMCVFNLCLVLRDSSASCGCCQCWWMPALT